ncbi:MAG: helix-turn-helix transcriptional regulator [Deltaproteobacteria bacterium]|nr:helix-turn-helix transcriptional regulator [Deltaproteobacteria bacterium]
MNPVYTLRACAGLTQQELARKAGTSQPTIAMYESGEKSPSMSTLQRLAASLGLELVVNYVSKLTREDHRSLAYHHAIAKALRQDPRTVIQRARRLLAHQRKDHPHAAQLLNQWQAWLDLPIDELIARMLDAGVMARDMRQVTPFAGVLNARERMRILKKFRREKTA